MKKLAAMFLALVLVLSMAACGAEPAAEENKELTKVSVAYMPNWGALWALATADAKGYFAEENLEIEMVLVEEGPTEIAALESAAIDIGYIGPGAHKLCSTGVAQVFLMQHLGQADYIIGMNGVKTLEDLRGKKVGYAAGTASEAMLLTALNSVGMTMEDINGMSMDATGLTAAALSGKVDAVSAWNPFAVTILAEAEDAVEICNNVDIPTVSPSSWVVSPDWAKDNKDTLVRFTRAMYKAMDYAACASTDDAVANEVAGYIADVIKADPELLLAQRYDGAWKTSRDIVSAAESGELLKTFEDQQADFVKSGALDASGILAPKDFVLVDVMQEAAK